jgi:ankyrin repeat protein
MAAAGVDYGLRVTRGRNRTEEGVLATMDLLVKAGADVNAHDVMDKRLGAGYTPGQSAASAASLRGRRDSQVPSANAVPNQTALHGAAEHGFNKFIEFLVANGADLAAKDANGRTPLEAARGAGGQKGGADAFPKTVALLESLMKEKGIPVAETAAK